MNNVHRTLIHRLIFVALSGVLAFPAIGAVAPLTARAAPGCTRTITGPHGGVLNVAGHQKLCLKNAVQNGAVNVSPNGALSVQSSRITGAVTLKSGFSSLVFCGSRTLRGAISATGGKGRVLVGSSAARSCAANTIDGAVTFDSNLAGVELGRNHIAGAVTANSNLGTSTISGNQIVGALTCTANSPAPTNDGVSNAVGGGRVGQTCASPTF